MMPVIPVSEARFGTTVTVLVAGGGACGLTAALAARDAGAEVVVLERSALPQGSTSMSGALIPAPASRWQRAAGLDDSPARMTADIMARTGKRADPVVVELCTRTAAATLEWLADRFALPFELAPRWQTLGHSQSRMHQLPGGTGEELMEHLTAAAGRAGVELVTEAHVTDLFAQPDGTVSGVRIARPDGGREDIGCRALVLATSGFGGDAAMVREHMPEIADATYFGWEHNRGDAIRWGRALGAAVKHLDAYQGFPALADPHRISINLEGLTSGGIQVNLLGERFYNEVESPSPGALKVLRQPEGRAINIYGQRQFETACARKRTRIADELGAVKHAPDVAALARAVGLPEAALAATLADTERLCATGATDRFGRRFEPGFRMAPPYHAIRVTGALYHTQGGLAVDGEARVLREGGRALPNLFAGGGAAVGMSGPGGAGYLPGNGLASALCLGRAAGHAAARNSPP
jgi:fumarate reductase flavoprotein subunit